MQEGHRRRERGLREALGDARRREAAAQAAAEALRAELAAGRAAMADAEARYWEAERSAREAAASREVTREAVIRLESRSEALDARTSDLLARITSARADLDALGAEESLPAEPPEDREPADGPEDPARPARQAALLRR